MNEWPIMLNNKHFCVNQHKTINDRINNAKNFILNNNYLLPIYVDNINNDYLNIYSSWPLRIYIIHQNIITWILYPKKPGYFNLNELKRVLDTYKKIIINNKTNTINKHDQCSLI